MVGPVALVRLKANREKRKICKMYDLQPEYDDSKGRHDQAELKRRTLLYPDIDKGWEETGQLGRGIVLDWFG